MLSSRKIIDVVHTIYEAVLHLPKPVRRVCIVSVSPHCMGFEDLMMPQVQIAAFMGWFPYLFYSTTYVKEVMANELGREPDIDKATRAGSLALLIYSFGTPRDDHSALTDRVQSRSSLVPCCLTSPPGTEDF